MSRTRYPLRDPSLPHQIHITWSSRGPHPVVGCNCTNHTPFGPAATVPEAIRHYNDPTNHILPFGDADKLEVHRG